MRQFSPTSWDDRKQCPVLREKDRHSSITSQAPKIITEKKSPPSQPPPTYTQAPSPGTPQSCPLPNPKREKFPPGGPDATHSIPLGKEEMRSSCRKVSPSCGHQPSSIVPRWCPERLPGRDRGRPAGRRLLHGPPQAPAERELGFQLARLSHPHPRGTTFIQPERRQPKPLLSAAALTLAGPGEVWPRGEAPGCGWKGSCGARRPAQVRLGSLSAVRGGEQPAVP